MSGLESEVLRDLTHILFEAYEKRGSLTRRVAELIEERRAALAKGDQVRAEALRKRIGQVERHAKRCQPVIDAVESRLEEAGDGR